MNRNRKTALAGGAALAFAAGGAGVAGAVGGGEDGEKQALGPDSDRAKAAAVKLVPGGKANAVELDSEKGATWEVEVREPDGSTVDVRLGAEFEEVAIDADSREPRSDK